MTQERGKLIEHSEVTTEKVIPIDKPFTSLFSTPTNNQRKKHFASTWLKAIKYHRKKLRKQKKIYCSLRECQLGISWGQEGQKVTSSNYTDIEAATGGTSSHKQFWKKPSHAKKYRCK